MKDLPTDLVARAQAAYDAVAADLGEHGERAAELVRLAREARDPEALVVSLRALAEAERLVPRNAAAKGLLDEAVDLAERHGLDQRLGELLVTRNAVRQELGDFKGAQLDVERAAGLLPPAEAGLLRFQLGVTEHNLGDLSAAAALYRLVLRDDDCSSLVRAKAGNNLAHLECELGHTESALQLLDDAAALAAEAGATVTAYVAQTRAWAEVQAGRLAESLVRFEAAHEAYGRAGLHFGEHYLEYAEALAQLRLVPEALEAARKGLAEMPGHEAPLMVAEARARFARVSLLAGQHDAARDGADESVRLMQEQDRPGWLARVLLVWAETRSAEGGLEPQDVLRLRDAARVLRENGSRGEAVEAHLLAGRAALQLGHASARADLADAARLSLGAPVLVRVRGHLARALLATETGDEEELLGACSSALDDLDQHRQALPSMELRARASGHGTELGALGLRALLRHGDRDADRLLAWMERTRAAALAPFEAPADDRVEQELVELRAVHAELTGLASTTQAEPPALLTRLRNAEAAVRRASWVGPGGVKAAPLVEVADRLRAELAGAVLVEFALLDGAVWAVRVGSSASSVHELGTSSGVVDSAERLQFAVRRMSRPTGSPVAAAAARRTALATLADLRARLLAPLALEPGVPLVVVPVGDLQRVPWAPLHDGPVTVVPSAAVWLRTRETRQRSGRIALLGGPDLPGASAELAALAEVHDGATVHADSTCAEAVEALRGADLAHFACHGRLRTDNPAFSALLLADGPLTVHELSRRAGTPARVVLAACESGAQVAFPGDEALGFVAALLARGCTGVVASDVLVPDEPSLPLMVALHRALAGGATTAQALRTARQVLDTDDPRQLAAWCAFDAYGGG